MGVKGSLISVNFVEHHFRGVIDRLQDFELQGPRFIFEASGSVRHQQGQKLTHTARRNFNAPYDRGMSAPPFPSYTSLK
ncbi:hypothetical protein SAMN05519103_09105 [Rhizobiales bacterium GAS113]|nr:hypothetical protein SAMN05519103_09105 [Rhizobiales bacterium GAS113]